METHYSMHKLVNFKDGTSNNVINESSNSLRCLFESCLKWVSEKALKKACAYIRLPLARATSSGLLSASRTI